MHYLFCCLTLRMWQFQCTNSQFVVWRTPPIDASLRSTPAQGRTIVRESSKMHFLSAALHHYGSPRKETTEVVGIHSLLLLLSHPASLWQNRFCGAHIVFIYIFVVVPCADRRKFYAAAPASLSRDARMAQKARTHNRKNAHARPLEFGAGVDANAGECGPPASFQECELKEKIVVFYAKT